MRGFGVSGERASGTTHLKKGLQKGSGQQGSQAGQGTFLFHVLRFWSRGYQTSAPMASRNRGFHHLIHSEEIVKPRDRGPCSPY